MESSIEHMMEKEIRQLEDWIKENQMEYRELRREYDRKRKALQNWAKPTIKPRTRMRKLEITKISTPKPVQAEEELSSEQQETESEEQEPETEQEDTTEETQTTI